MEKNQCEKCTYWKPLCSCMQEKCCHYLLITGEGRARDGEKCLSYAADNRKCRKDVS